MKNKINNTACTSRYLSERNQVNLHLSNNFISFQAIKILLVCFTLCALALTTSAFPVSNKVDKLDKDDINALLKEIAASQDDSTDYDGDQDDMNALLKDLAGSQDDASDNDGDDLSEIQSVFDTLGQIEQEHAKEIQDAMTEKMPSFVHKYFKLEICV